MPPINMDPSIGNGSDREGPQKIRVPKPIEPSPFYGNFRDIDRFIKELVGYFVGYSHFYEDEELGQIRRVWTALYYCKGEINTWATNALDQIMSLNHPPWTYSWQLFVEELNRKFGRCYKKFEAGEYIRNYRKMQSNETINSWQMRLERAIPWSGYNNDAILDHLLGNIKRSIFKNLKL